MEQLFNSLLGEMSVEDLSQRYADTYCHYFGAPKYIHGFMCEDDGTILVEYANINIGKGRCDNERKLFRWAGLNIARPAAGWYFLEDYTPFMLSYPVKKQYKRGMGVRNSVIFSPHGAQKPHGSYFHAALTGEDKFHNLTDATFEQRGSVIPRRDRGLFFIEADHWDFYYRQTYVGSVHPSKGLIKLEKSMFEQELREVSRSSLLDACKVEVITSKPKEDGIILPYHDEEDEFAEDGARPGRADDQDWIDGAILRGVRNPSWYVTDNASFIWVCNQAMGLAKTAIFKSHLNGVLIPNVSVVATVTWTNYQGKNGTGTVFHHPGKGNTIEQWKADGRVVLAATMYTLPQGKYKIAWIYVPSLDKPHTYIIHEKVPA